MWRYTHTDELYHYGVPGMRWGHRRNRSVVSTRKAFKQAKKAVTKAKVKTLLDKSTWIAGHDNNVRSRKNMKNIDRLTKAREKAAFKAIDAQAKYAYDKKLARTGSKAKAENAAAKVHARAMNKSKYGSGLSGSINDVKTGKGNTRYYNHLMKTKGHKYANKVEKKYSQKITRDLVGGVALTLGTAVALRLMEDQ